MIVRVSDLALFLIPVPSRLSSARISKSLEDGPKSSAPNGAGKTTLLRLLSARAEDRFASKHQ
jgi:hypothetical protein